MVELINLSWIIALLTTVVLLFVPAKIKAYTAAFGVVANIFPKEKEYTSHYHDFFEFRLIRIITNRLIYSANYFKFIQNGRIQSYVLYGIVFIIAIFILTIFKIVP